VKDDGTVKLGAWLNDAQTLHEQDIRETDELVYGSVYLLTISFLSFHKFYAKFRCSCA
jgi:hypothetical protein